MPKDLFIHVKEVRITGVPLVHH